MEFKSDNDFHFFASQIMEQAVPGIAYIVDKDYNLVCCSKELREIADIEYVDEYKPAPHQKINQILAKSFGFSTEESEQFMLKDLEVMTNGKKIIDRISTHSNNLQIKSDYECVREPWKLRNGCDVFVVLK